MIYTISDIHGNGQAWKEMLNKINFSNKDTMYILGDVIDRGPDGIRILMDIMSRKNMHMILGNHELMLLTSIITHDYPSWRNWTSKNNGGYITYLRFKELDVNKQLDLLAYLIKLESQLNVTVNDQKFLLVHANCIEVFNQIARKEDEDARSFCAWDRDHISDLNSYGVDNNTIVIMGHTPTLSFYEEDKTAEIYQCGNLIDIDCGCGWINDDEVGKFCRLACLRLDDMAPFYV